MFKNCISISMLSVGTCPHTDLEWAKKGQYYFICKSKSCFPIFGLLWIYICSKGILNS